MISLVLNPLIIWEKEPEFEFLKPAQGRFIYVKRVEVEVESEQRF